MLNIRHRPLINQLDAITFLAERFDSTFNYVCTTSCGYQAFAVDVYYTKIPLVKYNSNYIGLHLNPMGNIVCSVNVDVIEDLDFLMMYSDGWHYSQHSNDVLNICDAVVSGGRNPKLKLTNVSNSRLFKLRSGNFV